ncbi:glycosyltransferase [Protaetiibacter intestinalis]|uniref:Glycosyl transferase family 28 n=1 Tax=Protaetiibacter intestinalis TaxID=2419774 RepID=A0A387BDF6_9MICO|nr:glycosyltransferase [Protaetiibacter intestinalis]AYF98919.1 glycosyl transferase family 28 [Protaetiibacter intestinalis]
MNQTLLICSGGGHLKQLYALAPRLGIAPEQQLWATFENGLSTSLLEGRDTVFVPFAAPRDAWNTARIAQVVRKLLASRDIDRVVSTGASPAVAALPQATMRGIPSHYIESAARADGPSLSAKIVSRFPRVHTYTQYPAWADGHWQFRGAIFDAYDAGDPVEVPRLRKVVVSLGTQDGYPFDRLVAALAPLVADAEVLWQTGPHDVSRFGVEGRATVPHAELTAAIEEADLVVAHAGVGAAVTAIEAGKCPVLVPRLARHHEHIDDHQVQIAQELARRGLAVHATPEQLSSELLLDAARRSTRTVGAAPFALDEQLAA